MELFRQEKLTLKDVGMAFNGLAQRHLLTNGAVEVRKFFNYEADQEEFGDLLMKCIRQSWDKYQETGDTGYFKSFDSSIAKLCDLRIVNLRFFGDIVDYLCEPVQQGGPRYKLHEMIYLVYLYRNLM